MAYTPARSIAMTRLTSSCCARLAALYCISVNPCKCRSCISLYDSNGNCDRLINTIYTNSVGVTLKSNEVRMTVLCFLVFLVLLPSSISPVVVVEAVNVSSSFSSSMISSPPFASSLLMLLFTILWPSLIIVCVASSLTSILSS